MRWLLVLCVLVAGTAQAQVATMAIVGDIQHVTWCTNATTAWDHGKANFDYLAARGDIDFVLQTGDLVEEFALSDTTDNCYCYGTAGAPTCADIDHPLYGTGTCSQCADPEAMACAGAPTAPRLYCEWARAQVLAGVLRAAEIPFHFMNGNHGYDTVPPLPLPGRTPADWTAYNTYFGPGNLSPHFEEMGTLVVDNTGVSLPPAVWQVFGSGGAQFLHISFPIAPWYSWAISGSTQDKEELLAFAEAAIQAHPGMPTILSAHMMVSFDGSGPSGLSCGLCQDEDYEHYWTGAWAFNNLAEQYPQVFMIVGGHDRGRRHYLETTNAGDSVLAMLVDNSFGFTDVDPASWIYTADVESKASTAVLNGGGGLAVILKMDLVRGRIYTWSYSDEAKERDERTGEYGARWAVRMAFCEDDSRFTLPAAACPQLEPSPRCCGK